MQSRKHILETDNIPQDNNCGREQFCLVLK